MLYLPFLQAHFARVGRFEALFELGTVRGLFRRAPVAFWFAFLATLLFALPLYVLKIELTPREVAWLPALRDGVRAVSSAAALCALDGRGARSASTSSRTLPSTAAASASGVQRSGENSDERALAQSSISGPAGFAAPEAAAHAAQPKSINSRFANDMVDKEIGRTPGPSPPTRTTESEREAPPPFPKS